ncbi:MAG TPA: hypothetical protein VG317_11940 [Pseudonocardiaceae bacterium]|nr:hypothetical protein [Pseudonocardiaceae bacterium]
MRTLVTRSATAARLLDSTRTARWLPLAAPGAVYLAVRVVQILLLWWLDAIQQKPLDLHMWDGNWYLDLARDGYHGIPSSSTDLHGHHTPYTAMGFFPAYPLLVRVASPIFFGNYAAAAIAVSTIAGMAAAYGVSRLVRDIGGSRAAALVTVVLFAAAPMSIVYSMAYPEAVQAALSAWALVGLLERKWLLAGWCAAMSGLVRPTALPLIAVVVAVAACGLIRGRASWKAITAALIAPIGLAAYILWVATQTGSLTGYFAIQESGWDLGFDGGAATTEWAANTLASDSSAFSILAVWLMIGSIVLAVYAVRRLPWSIWAYGALTVLMTLATSGVMSTKPRELLPAFVLLIPVAIGISRHRPGKAIILTAMWAGFGLWFSAYGLTTWHYSI